MHAVSQTTDFRVETSGPDTAERLITRLSKIGELLNKGKHITVTSMRNKMLGIEEEVIDPLKDKSLMPVYREHVKHVSDLVGKEYAKGTLKRFKEPSLHWKLSCSTRRWRISSCESSTTSL